MTTTSSQLLVLLRECLIRTNDVAHCLQKWPEPKTGTRSDQIKKKEDQQVRKLCYLPSVNQEASLVLFVASLPPPPPGLFVVFNTFRVTSSTVVASLPHPPLLADSLLSFSKNRKITNLPHLHCLPQITKLIELLNLLIHELNNVDVAIGEEDGGGDLWSIKVPIDLLALMDYEDMNPELYVKQLLKVCLNMEVNLQRRKGAMSKLGDSVRTILSERKLKRKREEEKNET